MVYASETWPLLAAVVYSLKEQRIRWMCVVP